MSSRKAAARAHERRRTQKKRRSLMDGDNAFDLGNPAQGIPRGEVARKLLEAFPEAPGASQVQRYYANVVQKFLNAPNIDGKSCVLGEYKNLINKRRVLCEDPGCYCASGADTAIGTVCPMRSAIAGISLIILCVPCNTKVARLASVLLSLSLAECASDVRRADVMWMATVESEIGALLAIAANPDSSVEKLAVVGVSLRRLFDNEVTREYLLTNVSVEDMLHAAVQVLQLITHTTLASVANASTSNQGQCVLWLDGAMNFLLDYLDMLIVRFAADDVVISQPAPVKCDSDSVKLLEALTRLRDQVLGPLLYDSLVSSTFAFKPVRYHSSVALARINRIVSCIAGGFHRADVVLMQRSSVLDLLDVAVPGNVNGFLRSFSRKKVGIEVCAIVLLQTFAIIPLETFFSQDNGMFLADLVWCELRAWSNEHVFEESIQTPCLKGMDEWCKHLQNGLSSSYVGTRGEAWRYWQVSARNTCVEVMRYVLDNWGHGARKARYHLEPLLHSALGTIDFVRLELRELAPELTEVGLDEDIAFLQAEHARFVKHLIAQVMEYESTSLKTNLKASLPLLADFVGKHGIKAVIVQEPTFLERLMRCFSEQAQVGQIASRIFLIAAKQLEKSSAGRSEWLLPVARQIVASVKDESENDLSASNAGNGAQAVGEAVTAALLPPLIKAFPDFSADALLEALGTETGKTVDLRKKMLVWNAFREAGATILFVTDDASEASTSSPANRDSILVNVNDVEHALLHFDTMTCVSALDMVTMAPRNSKGGSKGPSLPSERVLEFNKTFFLALTKWSHASLRHRVLIGAQHLFEWIQAGLGNATAVKADPNAARRCVAYLHWLQRHLIASAHPLAPLDRSETALEVLLQLVSMFGTTEKAGSDKKSSNGKGGKSGESIAANLEAADIVNLTTGLPFVLLAPLQTDLEARDRIFVLVNMLMNAYDKARELAFRVLTTLAPPLAGLADAAAVRQWLKWAFVLLAGARVRDSDAGASMVRLLYSKCVRKLGWLVVFPKPPCSNNELQHELQSNELEKLALELQTAVDLGAMHLATLQAKFCSNAPKAYNVGAVIIDADGAQLAQGFSRELPGNTHAEESAFIKLGGLGLSAAMVAEDTSCGKARGTTIYTTMEPCSVRLSGNRSCTSRCIAAEVRRVVVGVKEPSKFVVCTGTQELRDAGITVDYIADKQMQRRCMDPNMFLFPEQAATEAAVEGVPDVEPTTADALRLELNALGQDLPRSSVVLHFMWQLVAEFNRRINSMELVSCDQLEWAQSGVIAVGAGMDEPDQLAAGTGLIEGDADANVFGVIRAIRYCWEDSEEVFNERWRPLVAQLLEILFRALNLAQAVIGPGDFENDDAADEEGRTAEEANNSNKHFMPIKSTVEVDCRGQLVIAGPIQGIEESSVHDSAGAQINKKNRARRIVMSSWLIVRDGSELLQTLVRYSPLQAQPDDSDSSWIMSFADVVRVGDWFLDALGALKHIGAIGYAVQGFQGVCGALLRLKKRKLQGAASESKHLLAMPQQWLERLLQRLSGGTQGFVLRKSAGFAGSFLALARSEPRLHKARLLDEMLTRLVAFATDHDGTAEVLLGTRVHAMNIIKILVEDSTLAGEIEISILNKVFILAVDGFCSPHWQVRNSAMMIYAKVLKRVAGQRGHQGTNESVGSRIGASAIFLKFPGIHARMLQDLTSCCVGNGANKQGSDSRLFPWLLFLSRLEPNFLTGSAVDFLLLANSDADQVSEIAARNKDVEALIPLLLNCAPMAEGMVRLMSARALGSVMPNALILPILMQLLQNLATTEQLTQNRLHGMLLEIIELLNAVFHRRVFVQVQKEFKTNQTIGSVLADTVEELDAALGLALDRTLSSLVHSGCMVVRDAAWNAVDAWLSLRRAHLANYSVDALPGEQRLLAVIRSSTTKSGGLDARALALACTYFPEARSEFLASNAGADPFTRVAALQAILADKSANNTSSSAAGVAAYLTELFMAESEKMYYPPEMEVRLALLARLLLQDEGLVAQIGLKPHALADRTLAMYELSEGQAVKIGSLQLLAALVPMLGEDGLVAVIAQVLLDAAQPTCTTLIRASAGHALRSSGLLFSGCMILAPWLALLKLMQDEADSIRVEAVRLANMVLLPGQEMQCESVVFAACFRHVATTFDSDQVWHKFAVDKISNMDLASVARWLIELDNTNLNITRTDLFEFEPDNVYSEPLLESALVASAGGMETAAAASAAAAYGDDQAQAVIELLSQLEHSTLWPGGTSFHPDIYRAIITESSRAATIGPDASVSLKQALVKVYARSLNSRYNQPLHPHIRALLTEGGDGEDKDQDWLFWSALSHF